MNFFFFLIILISARSSVLNQIKNIAYNWVEQKPTLNLTSTGQDWASDCHLISVFQWVMVGSGLQPLSCVLLEVSLLSVTRTGVATPPLCWEHKIFFYIQLERQRGDKWGGRIPLMGAQKKSCYTLRPQGVKWGCPTPFLAREVKQSSFR